MAKKENILFVGEHPKKGSGNGNMMDTCIKQTLKMKNYKVAVFAAGDYGTQNPFMQNYQCPTISAKSDNDTWGKQKLIDMLAQIDIDQLIFVGIDLWRYAECFRAIKDLQKKKHFTWKVLVPYDLAYPYEEWIDWFNLPDVVFVYSKFAAEMLKDKVENLYYYQPELNHMNQFFAIKDKQELRKKIFPRLDEDATLYGFIGNNQLRKNIYHTLWGFAEALPYMKDKKPVLYIHTDRLIGVNNIPRIIKDLKIPSENIILPEKNRFISSEEMNLLFNCFDYHVLFSLQEGLSWTVVEAKLTGTPSLLSYTTAHEDFEDYSSLFAEPDHWSFLALMTGEGPIYLPTPCCSEAVITNVFIESAGITAERYGLMSESAIKFGRNWCDATHHISYILKTDAKTDPNTIEGEFI